MTSSGFEKEAKAQLVSAILQAYDEAYTAEQIYMVWFSRILGHMKGMFIDRGNNNRYYEVTYHSKEDEMYIDMYEKKKNIVVENVSEKG